MSRKWYGFANGCLEVRGFDEWGGLLVVIVNGFGKSGVFFQKKLDLGNGDVLINIDK